ncbi:MAG: VCBS repeat-containing protein, partial [Planctomycetaceae bacterium]|nr:VCBS repeat-containing protein [Planctomycetaceae bacterium]
VLGGTNHSPAGIVFNDGFGRQSTFDTSVGNALYTTFGFRDIALGDLDGDGDLDFFGVGYGGLQVGINNGQGTFAPTLQDFTIGAGATDVELADIDGDGDLDAVIVHQFDKGANFAMAWLNNGHGYFSDTGITFGDPGASDIALGELDDPQGLATEDAPFTVSVDDLLGNDSDVDTNDVLVITSVGGTEDGRGDVTLIDGSVVYNPNGQF